MLRQIWEKKKRLFLDSLWWDYDIYKHQPLLLLLSSFSHVWLCDPIDSNPRGSPVPGILQARTLAISFSNAWKWKVKVKLLSHVWLFVTPWTAAYQAPPPMGFSRQEYWSGVPLPSPKIRVDYVAYPKMNCLGYEYNTIFKNGAY